MAYSALPSINEIAKLLGGDVSGNEIRAPGPNHSAADRSMSIKIDPAAPDGMLVHSFSGDDDLACKNYVWIKLGLPPSQPEKMNGKSAGPGTPWRLVREYVYHTEAREPFLLVREFRDRDGKKIYPQSHWDGHQWVKGKPTAPKIPYRLPELLATPLTATIYFAEGEKCADALAKLGFIATTVSEGAKAKWDKACTPFFKDRPLVVLVDGDDPGRAHGQKIAKALDGTAASVRVVDLFPDRNDGSDVADWLIDDRSGARLVQTAKAAPLWEPGPDNDKTDKTSEDEDDLLIAELAMLSPVQYEKRREAAAEQLGVRVSVLDKLVEDARAESEDEKTEPSPALFQHWNVEPAAEPINGSALLGAIVDVIKRFVFLSKDQAVAVALWVVFTWLHEHQIITHSPILFVTSAERDSGKTTLLNVTGFLARRGLASVGISSPALFRSIKKWQPMLIIDESDDAFDNTADLRSVVNSGWTRGSGIIRCDPDTNEPVLYSTFTPKALGMKGRRLPDTTLSRSIIITMRPRRPDDPAEYIDDFNHTDNETFARLRSQIMRWTNDNADALGTMAPATPSGFHNRRRANWKMLLAIAERAGGEWKAAAWKAALAIEAVHETFDPSIGVQLLQAIRDAFAEQATDRITSEVLVAGLTSDQTGPWASYGKSQKPISQNGVARLLKPFGIKPRTVRFPASNTAKGYHRSWFNDAFDRHLPPSGAKTGIRTATPEHDNDLNSLGQKETVTPESDVTVENAPNPLNDFTCDGVTVRNPESEGEEDNRCGQCHGAVDGTEREYLVERDRVWLHEQCRRFYLEARGVPA